jgi:hypothetical protein
MLARAAQPVMRHCPRNSGVRPARNIASHNFTLLDEYRWRVPLTDELPERTPSSTEPVKASLRWTGPMSKVIEDLQNIVDEERSRSKAFGGVAVVMALAGVALLIYLGASGLRSIDRPLAYDPVPSLTAPLSSTTAPTAGSPATVAPDRSAAQQTVYAPTDTIVTARTFYLLVRGTGLAAIIGGIIFFVGGLARSALDQATRHEKRLIAAKVMDVVTVGADNQLDEERLHLAHEVLTVWGNTVESAYTPPRSVKKIQTEIEGKAGDRSGRVSRNEDGADGNSG